MKWSGLDGGYTRWFSAAAGVTFVALVLVAFLIDQGPPDDASGPAQFAYYLAHTSELKWQAVFSAIGGLGFLFFFASLAARACSLDERSRPFAYAVLLTAAVTAVFFSIGVLTPLVLAHCNCDPSVDQGREVTLSFLLFRDLGDEASVFTGFPAAALIASAGAAILMTGWIRIWIGGLAFPLAALILVSAVLQEVSADFDLLGDISLMAFLIWVLIAAGYSLMADEEPSPNTLPAGA